VVESYLGACWSSVESSRWMGGGWMARVSRILKTGAPNKLRASASPSASTWSEVRYPQAGARATYDFDASSRPPNDLYKRSRVTDVNVRERCTSSSSHFRPGALRGVSTHSCSRGAVCFCRYISSYPVVEKRSC
jgi:hypothetical protein